MDTGTKYFRSHDPSNIDITYLTGLYAGDAGDNAGLVGLYAGLVGLYAGLVGL